MLLPVGVSLDHESSFPLLCSPVAIAILNLPLSSISNDVHVYICNLFLCVMRSTLSSRKCGIHDYVMLTINVEPPSTLMLLRGVRRLFFEFTMLNLPPPL